MKDMFAHIVEVRHAAAADVTYVCQIEVRKARKTRDPITRRRWCSPKFSRWPVTSACDHVRFDAVRCERCIWLQSASGTVIVHLK